MSDTWIVIVPKPTGHVPDSREMQAALSVLRELTPKATEHEILSHEGIQLFDCGSNMEKITCPHCQANISFDWWSETMSDDYDESGTHSGFRLELHMLPCCGSQASMDELKYQFNMAFGHTAISALNPDVLLEREDIGKLETAMGCEVSLVYQHI